MRSSARATGNGNHSGGKSLQRTLALWFSLIALLSCVVVGVVGAYLRAQGMRESLSRQLETMRDYKVRTISAWLRERRGDLQVLSEEPGIVELCEKRSRGESFDAIEVRSRLRRIASSYNYEAVFISDPETGLLIVTTDPENEGQHRLLDSYRERVLSEKQILISDVFLDEVHRRPEIVIAGPIVSADTNAVIGIAACQDVAETRLYPLVMMAKPLGETDEIVVVNQDRLVQVPLRNRPDAVLDLTIKAEAATRGAAGETGRIQTRDYRRVPVAAAYGHIPETRWGLVVRQDMAEINAPVFAMMRRMALVSAGALVIAVFVGLVTARRIAGPATHIATVAERIGGGDMAMRAEEKGPLEIRQVARNLNRMVEKLQNAQQELVRKERLAMLGQLVSSIAHELRNPLGAIRNAAYFLRSGGEGQHPKWSKHLAIIEKEVKTSDRIIRGLLDMTRGKRPEKREIELGQVLRSAWSRASISEAVKLDLTFNPDPFVMHADPAQFEQVLANILQNADQAMDGRGEIVVIAERQAAYDEIIVKDSGSGVSSENRDRIFEPLFSTKTKGTGLGLPISRQIVERHDGTLDLVDGPGRGSAFRIRLPHKAGVEVSHG